MRRKLLLLLLLAVSALHVQAQHFEQINIPSERQDNVLDFLYMFGKTGYLSSTNYLGDDTLFKTTDSGKTWDVVPLPKQMSHIISLFCLDSLHCYISDFGSRFFYSANGGRSWTLYTVGISDFAGPTFFVNDSVGYMTYYSYIFKTTSRGQYWNLVLNAGANTLFNDIQFVDSLHGVVVGWNAKVWMTNDAGKTWRYHNPDLMGQIFSSYSFNEDTDIIVGHDPDSFGYIARTTDGGKNWEVRFMQDWQMGFGDIHFTDNQHGYAVGATGDDYKGRNPVVAITKDGGDNWTFLKLPYKGTLHTIKFIDDTTAFMAGTQGLLLKMITTGKDTFTSVENIRCSKAHSITIYPNPASCNITLSYTVPSSSLVSLELLDISGRVIDRPVYEKQAAGDYHFPYNTAGLAPGVYMFRLRAGNQVVTNKFVKTE